MCCVEHSYGTIKTHCVLFRYRIYDDDVAPEAAISMSQPHPPMSAAPPIVRQAPALHTNGSTSPKMVSPSTAAAPVVVGGATAMSPTQQQQQQAKSLRFTNPDRYVHDTIFPWCCQSLQQRQFLINDDLKIFSVLFVFSFLFHVYVADSSLRCIFTVNIDVFS